MFRPVLFSFFSILVGISSQTVIAQMVVEISAANRIALGIETVDVESAASYSGATATAVIVAPPHQTINIISPFDSVMLQPLVVAGARVEAGQSIALLQSADFAAAQADLETQVINVKHDDYLAQNAKELEELGLKSAQEADEAEHEAETSKLKLRAMQAKLSSVKPADGSSQFVLTTFAEGIVTHIEVMSGDAVGTTMPVVTLFKGQEYWASAQLPERVFGRISVGMDVVVAGNESIAEVIAIDPEVDQESRSIEVLVKMPADTSWYLGQLVDLAFSASLQADSLSVPTKSIFQIDGAHYVFLQVDEGFKAIPVEIITRSRDTAIVRADLVEGSALAISGLAALKNIVEGG